MRTHNRLLNLFGGAYLEVIAIDPAAPRADAPRPRLFALDDPALQRRLNADGPQLVHWVARVDRPKSLGRWREQYPARIAPVVAMSRGGNTWNLTVPDDGAFPAWQGTSDGVMPSLIQWDTPRHPERYAAADWYRAALADGVSRAGADRGRSACVARRVEATAGAPALVAEFELPDGSVVTMGESAEWNELAARAQEEV